MANPATLPILLKELHLSCLASQWERLQEQALANHWPLAQYLTVLCENEVAHRQSLRLQRYLKESHLPATKTLSQFDFSVCAQINPAQIAHLAQNADWVERADNLLLFGPSGVGKTHLAAAIGHGLIEQGQRVLLHLNHHSGTAATARQAGAKTDGSPGQTG